VRLSVRKHYNRLDQFVRLANLGWDEIFKRDDFPTLDKLDPHDKHRQLLVRIDRAFDANFRKIRPPANVPLLISPSWRTTSAADWKLLHCFALVRRIFDSLNFLTQSASFPRPATLSIALALQVAVADDGSVVRVRDPYEDFLSELSRCDLRRLRACAACKRFFVAWRKDRKACGRRCANLIRVHRFRQKKDEYVANRNFRKRAGLAAVTHGRDRLMRLHESLRSNEYSAEPTLAPDPAGSELRIPPRRPG
jgi:hypothetical protein